MRTFLFIAFTVKLLEATLVFRENRIFDHIEVDCDADEYITSAAAFLFHLSLQWQFDANHFYPAIQTKFPPIKPFRNQSPIDKQFQKHISFYFLQPSRHLFLSLTPLSSSLSCHEILCRQLHCEWKHFISFLFLT